jgi:hypothetical protein
MLIYWNEGSIFLNVIVISVLRLVFTLLKAMLLYMPFSYSNLRPEGAGVKGIGVHM